METKFLKVVGYWAIGLGMFVATMIIIRWTIDFVTWSTLESGWAQVIGSIAALGVAIYVMSRQNAHAAKLLVDADTLALRRRAAAVSAIVERVMIMAVKSSIHASQPLSQIPDVAKARGALTGNRRAIAMMMSKVDAVPLHELGSFEMVEGLQRLHGNLAALDMIYQRLLDQQAEWGSQAVVKSIADAVGHLRTAAEQFEKGARDIG